MRRRHEAGLAHRSQGLSAPALSTWPGGWDCWSSRPLSSRSIGAYISLSIILVGVLKIVSLALIVSMSVQGDSLVGSTSFWLSRPVSARQLLAGKSVFLAGALISPTLLVEVLFLLFNRVTAWDILRSVPQTLFYSILAVAILMVLAAVTRNLLQMLAFGLVSVVVMTLLFISNSVRSCLLALAIASLSILWPG